MVPLKTAEDLKSIRKAGRIIADCHKEIARRITPGVTTLEIDRFVERFMMERGAYPAQKGYKGYPYATCAAVNDVVCHGFPDSIPLMNGDIVTIDMVADVGGWKADSAWTYAIGTQTADTSRLLRIAKLALRRGIAEAVPGKRIGDIGFAIQNCAQQAGYRVVDLFTGHGIGRFIHEPPEILHRGSPGYGERLEAGMVITIEPIITEGRPAVQIERDGWTARTVDGSRSAQFEHTIAITEKGPVILTRS
ncbi:type I methionyl aminopeptidase [Paenibacillus protaetiae]|uniref:Methionine aminopeptidase n=1 Tax=Paenibacillus protaetiae TaxID=2509456 RepID=A0A4P6EZH6_9BACL|nr:type I methionyl aminopeptidase [Paenibacillus protaetiae]QAY68494.1 type I methionyl aminopeptidase [Paenibacillus protaetiae]